MEIAALGVIWLVAAVLVIVGVLGVVLPALPGTPLVFAGILLVAWIDKFQRIGPWTLVLVGVLGLLTLLVDYVAAALGTKGFGGTRWGLAGAVVGLLDAGLFLGLPGILIGPPAGAILFELVGARQSAKKALGAGVGAFVGFLLGTVAKYALVLAMIVAAAVAYLT